MSAKRHGFSKIELLVVFAIVSVIGGLLLVMLATTGNPERGYATAWFSNNLKQLALAVHTYHDVHKKFPPATGKTTAIPNGNRSLSIHLLPYVENNALYQQYIKTNDVPPIAIHEFQTPFDQTTPDWIRVQNFAGNVRVFTDIGVKTSYTAAVTGLNANNGACSTTLGETFTDGTSNTILFSTRYANGGEVTGNGNVTCSAYDALLGSNNSAFFGVEPLVGRVSATSSGGWQLAPTLAQVNCEFGVTAHSFEPRGLRVSLADGSGRLIAPRISASTWNALMQPNDGKELGSDW